MADCYYHGYSGGPGACPECEEEDRRGLPRDTLSGPTNDMAKAVMAGPEQHPDPTVRAPKKRNKNNKNDKKR